MPDKDVASLMREAQSTSEEYHELANLISKQIVEFDDWLSKLPGKIEVETHGENPEHNPDHDSDRFLLLAIRRVAREWALSYSYTSESQHPDFAYADVGDASWRPLRDASLTIKAHALRLLPALLELFLYQQKALIEVMSPVTKRRRSSKEGA